MFREEWAAFSIIPNKFGKYSELNREYSATYTFDVNGKLIFSDPSRQGIYTMISEQVPTYDDKGNLVEELIYDHRGIFSAKTTFKYDDNGKRTESAYYGPNGLIWVRKYDTEGREFEATKYDGEGYIEYREVNAFEDNGNYFGRLTYTGDGILMKRERVSYEYDQKGNWIKRVLYECNAKNEKLPCKPQMVFYRFIKYY
jgi:hypothetical protein